MKLVFSGLEKAIELQRDSVAVLQIENSALFSRIALSLMEGGGLNSLEPHALWDGEEEIRFCDRSIFISDPLNLPWSHKDLMGEVIKKMEREILEDEDLRAEIESAERLLASSLLRLSLELNSEYNFGLEWDFKRYLKMLGFGIDASTDRPYLDNLMSFISLVLDSGSNKVLVFVNLKTFLTESETKRFYEHIFFSGIRVLMLENMSDEAYYEHERKTIVDQHFLEF